MKLVTEEWLDRAGDDLDVAKEIMPVEHLTNMVAFHCQQAVEKTLKAIIEELEIAFVKTHNLERLMGIVKQKMDIDIDIDIVKRLDEVYISARYPGDLGLLPSGKPSVEDARMLYEFAKNISDDVRQTLKTGSL